MPVTSHCYFEVAGLIPTDDCCSQGESRAASKHDSCESRCNIVEKAGYKFQENQAVLPVAILFSPVFLQPSLPEPPAEIYSSRVAAWPPDNLHLPQFTARTALPVRAPSLAS